MTDWTKIPVIGQNEEVSRELANRDLADIKELRATAAFERYWMRRIKQKKEAYDKAFHEDQMSHEEREVHRRLVAEYAGLISMIARDEFTAKRMVD